MRKLLIWIFEKCRIDGCKWKKQPVGWTMNPKFDVDKGIPQSEPMTIPWTYWRCKHCGAIEGEVLTLTIPQ